MIKTILTALLTLVLFAGTALGQVKIDATTAHQMASEGEVLLLDIRTPREWKQTGVSPLAETLNVRSQSFGTDFMALIDGDRSRPIALICASGGRSGRLADVLANAGFSTVFDVSEGMNGSGAGPGWIAAGLPTENYQR